MRGGAWVGEYQLWKRRERLIGPPHFLWKCSTLISLLLFQAKGERELGNAIPRREGCPQPVTPPPPQSETQTLSAKTPTPALNQYQVSLRLIQNLSLYSHSFNAILLLLSYSLILLYLNSLLNIRQQQPYLARGGLSCQYIQVGMEKYKVTEKQLKTRSSTYYRAINLQTQQKVLIKKLNKGRTWEEILSDRFINLMKLERYSWAPRIIEIVKDQDRHYVVFEDMEKNLPELIASDKSPAMIATVARKISEILCELKAEGLLSPAIKAEYFFVNKNDIKLTHVPEGEQLDLTNASPERAGNKQITDKSSVFELACLMVEGMVGKPLIQAANKKEYQQIINKLFSLSQDKDNSESIRNILKSVTSDYQFIQVIEAMLNPDPSKRPTLQSSSNTLKRFSPSDSLSPNATNNKLLFLSTLQKIDSNKINILRKCNQISTKFLDDDYLQLAEMPRIVSESEFLPPEQNATDNVVMSKVKQEKRNFIIQHPIVSPKNRQKGTETLPKLYNKREQYTNYALYKHQNLGVESDQLVSQKFQNQQFTNI